MCDSLYKSHLLPGFLEGSHHRPQLLGDQGGNRGVAGGGRGGGSGEGGGRTHLVGLLQLMVDSEEEVNTCLQHSNRHGDTYDMVTLMTW